MRPCNSFYILGSVISLYITRVYAPGGIQSAEPETRTFAFSPYWADYVSQNGKHIRWIAEAVDWLHMKRDQECPVGELLKYTSPDGYKRSLNYLSDALDQAQVRFESAYKTMMEATPEAQTDLTRFKFNTTETATEVLDVISHARDYISKALTRYHRYGDMIGNIPGRNFPPMSSPSRNLLRLSLVVNSATVNAGARTVTIPKDGAAKFLEKWREVYRAITADVKFAKRAETFAFTYMNSKAATDLLEGWEDPGSSIGENQTTFDPFSYSVIWYRIRKWFQCWQYPMFDMIDYTANLLNPVPEPGEPMWTMQSQENNI
ncbi:hypothetical protein H072_11500 [Dactylellina haptotyla CBS 200.50]|uniref:Uncharacterized protein n=1 Tax=Dactylellina haptotyla (strain CBS 200.50) TaxID=1284197 RepID=S8B7Z4_DACHA|nr:hypothetical protein H072_11500 [Dactylellina haptotyla CBS 200.50]